MRNIILEGPDNAGKTTLAKFLQRAIQWPLKDREGRPESFEATLLKCERYLTLRGQIIDRHPIVSQSIYGAVLRGDPQLPNALMDEFHRQDNLIIYCRCVERGLEGHEPSMQEAGLADTVEHLVSLNNNYKALLKAYDWWAVKRAHIIYSDYSQMEWILSMIRGLINERHSVDA